jgi:hypothetical protein
VLATVLDRGMSSLVTSRGAIVDEAAEIKDGRTRAETLPAKVWEVLTEPQSVSILEILIATRSVRGALNASDLSALAETWGTLSVLLGEGSAARRHRESAVAQRSRRDGHTNHEQRPMPVHDEHQAMANLIADRLSPHKRRPRM